MAGDYNYGRSSPSKRPRKPPRAKGAGTYNYGRGKKAGKPSKKVAPSKKAGGAYSRGIGGKHTKTHLVPPIGGASKSQSQAGATRRGKPSNPKPYPKAKPGLKKKFSKITGRNRSGSGPRPRQRGAGRTRR